MRESIRFLIVLSATCASGSLFATTQNGFSSSGTKARSLSGPALLAHYQHSAEAKSLADQPRWLNLLFYKERLSHLFGRRSLIDDPAFFLAPRGDTDPAAELNATLAAFLKGGAGSPQSFEENRHPLCRFPARLEFLQQELAIPSSALAKADCPERDQFMAKLAYDRVSLVFAHYFINSPQSMFGHTFLRLRVKEPAGKARRADSSPLLDDVVNFSAQVPPDQVNGPFYAISGLLGGYRGRFQLMAYYQKVQEYNNLESRDLWEYPLDLSERQIRSLQKVLWEMGDTYINYYFLTENCSYALLGLLETVLPDNRLTSHFPLVAIPADTLRAVVENPTYVEAGKQPGDGGKLSEDHKVPVTYRPSGLARFLWQSQTLTTAAERQGVAQLVGRPDAKLSEATMYEDCSVACKARLLDTAIEYIDFYNRVGVAREGGDYGPLRQQLLATRAGLPTMQSLGHGGTLKVSRPISDPPHLGHRSSMIGFGAARQRQGDLPGYLHFRPALQDIAANPRGYSDQMEIRFFDLWLDITPGEADEAPVEDKTSQPQVAVSRFSLIKIFSLPDSTVLLTPKAWSFDLGFEPFALLKDAQRLRHRYHLSISVGQSFRAHGERPLIRPFALVGGKAYTEYQARHSGFAPFLTLGSTVAGRLPARLTLQGTLGSNFDRVSDLYRQGEGWLHLEGILSVDLSTNLEARLHSEAFAELSTWRLGLEYYF